jgi:hypothetical protein
MEYGRTLAGTAGYGPGSACGRGFRGGRGSGRRIPRRYENNHTDPPVAAAANPADELNMLKTETESLNSTLRTLNNRITEIEKLL